MKRGAIFLLTGALVAACGPDFVPTPAISPISTIAPTPAAIGVDWTLADLPETGGRWFASGVIADGDGFVMYGTANDRAAIENGEPQSQVWRGNAP
ncbi:MAG: hypothetical protein ABI620_09915 [Chloroflexota bacterium]